MNHVIRPSCPQIYSSPCLDQIFSALLEVQPKLSRNAVIYLNSARNQGQFWSIWGYLCLATFPVLTAQLMREVSVVPPVPHPAPLPSCPGMPVQGVDRDVLWSSPVQQHPSRPIPGGDGERSRGSGAGPSTHPEGSTPQENSSPLPAHHLLLQLTRGQQSLSGNSQGCFPEWKYSSTRHFLHFPCNKGCAGWEELFVTALWEQKCSFHSWLSNAWRLCRSDRSGYRWTHHFSKLAQQHGSSPQYMSTDLCISLKQPIWNDH